MLAKSITFASEKKMRHTPQHSATRLPRHLLLAVWVMAASLLGLQAARALHVSQVLQAESLAAHHDAGDCQCCQFVLAAAVEPAQETAEPLLPATAVQWQAPCFRQEAGHHHRLAVRGPPSSLVA